MAMADKKTYPDPYGQGDRCSACGNYVDTCEKFGCHPPEEKVERDIFADYNGPDNPYALPMDADGNLIEPDPYEFMRCPNCGRFVEVCECDADQKEAGVKVLGDPIIPGVFLNGQPLHESDLETLEGCKSDEQDPDELVWVDHDNNLMKVTPGMKTRGLTQVRRADYESFRDWP